MHEDEIWDEERWEAFLRENDRRVNRFMDLLFNFLTEHPLPEEGDEAGRRFWESQLRDFLEGQGFYPEDHGYGFFFDLFDTEDEADEEEAGVGWFGLEDEEAFDDEALFEDALQSFRELPVYQQAFRLATEVLEWANALPGDVKDSTLVQFCTHVTQIPANIAKGHGIGYERDMIGGNIACAKRGLAAANAALGLLREMKAAPYMPPDVYRRLYEQAFEVRNELGLYVQDLRRRFDLGID
ncbi:four helix bundle protein [Rhodocaloribacter litoris]|uniref:four helix bundle protein n=1 Tax=Rhodocaloribacter litoris TaxID=2558931 RepID=UPI00141EF9C7|nr:four helix bundle protein [Rhodocaloribacter litoris]QXD14827.1 four helix bundle protein [Rhodocaloribacter litoris]